MVDTSRRSERCFYCHAYPGKLKGVEIGQFPNRRRYTRFAYPDCFALAKVFNARAAFAASAFPSKPR
jgi:hypothetical protein